MVVEVDSLISQLVTLELLEEEASVDEFFKVVFSMVIFFPELSVTVVTSLVDSSVTTTSVPLTIVLCVVTVSVTLICETSSLVSTKVLLISTMVWLLVTRVCPSSEVVVFKIWISPLVTPLTVLVEVSTVELSDVFVTWLYSLLVSEQLTVDSDSWVSSLLEDVLVDS